VKKLIASLIMAGVVLGLAIGCGGTTATKKTDDTKKTDTKETAK